MPVRLSPLLLGLLLAGGLACSYSPSYQGSVCAEQEPRCPAGFTCQNGICQSEGQQDDGEPQPPGDDGGPLNDDAGPADGGDVCCPGDVATDAGDGGDIGDAGDTEPDGGADGGPGEGDEGPGDDDPCASKQCPGGYYCNPDTGTCQPCDTVAACGSDCLACAPEATCEQLGEEHCCRPPCTAGNACQELACGAAGWICALKFNPERWEWYQQGPGTDFCTLAEPSQPGENVPLAGTFTCLDDDTLGYYCTYDGACNGGSCQPNAAPGVQDSHICGEVFGCDAQANRCRLHKKVGSACNFNYDCQSFCCSREQNASCLVPDAGRTNCKIAETEYRSDWTDYTWVAYAEPDPHDISAWLPHSGHDAPACSADFDCDSGDCGSTSKRCRFPSCFNTMDPENNIIRDRYFCSAGVGDGSAGDYLPLVTNQNPEPGPGDCQ